MNQIQTIIVLSFGLLAFINFLISLNECRSKKNPYGLTYINRIYGAFVYADMVIFGVFWTLVSVSVLILNDWLLFLLILALFWTIRSFGEMLYWFHQQFSPLNKNPIQRFVLKNIFHNESIWFVYQIFWQCILIIGIISTILSANLWLKTI